ncbi:MAG: acyl carrier protein [Casimicrobiaceae bacterium]
MQDGTEQRVRRIMADILNLDAGRIDENTSMDNTEAWDSANHISLVLALEDEFGIAFDVADIEGMRSFFDLVQGVGARI